MTDGALILKDVVKSFGDHRAVNELTFAVPYGQVVSLLGPNGAGKTTTIDMCEGFQKPDSGTIEVLGQAPGPAVRQRLGIMLQGGGAYPGIRVGEMLKLVASYYSEPLDVDWLLEAVGLQDHRRTSYRRLSGGQQQRLSLACALVGRPELLFLDEPTAGMDAQSRLMVWELIDSLRRDGATVLLTTHFMDEAEALSDQVVIIDRGSVVAQGTPADLTTRGTSQVTFTTAATVDLARVNHQLNLNAANASLNGSLEIKSNRPLHYQLSIDPTPQHLAALMSALAEQDVLVTSLDVNHRSLEDVFLDLTGRSLRAAD